MRTLTFALLALLLAGCAGSKGSSSNQGCSSLTACSQGEYDPNYVDDFSDGNKDSDLFYWPQIDVAVFYAFANPDLIALADQAFGAWRDNLDTLLPTCEGLFRFVSSQGDAKIVFRFVTQEEVASQSGNNRSIGLTRFFYRAGTRQFTSAEIYVAISEDGTDYSDAKILRIAKHEIGHAMGIAAHSATLSDKMYAFDSPANAEVTERDVNTLAYSYCVQNRGRTGLPDAPVLSREIACP